MGDAKHRPEPWMFDGFQRIRAVNGKQDGTEDIAHIYSSWSASRYDAGDYANANRIVACVNGCEGINPEAVKDLLAALEGMLHIWRDVGGDQGNYYVEQSEAAIAKAKGTSCP